MGFSASVPAPLGWLEVPLWMAQSGWLWVPDTEADQSHGLGEVCGTQVGFQLKKAARRHDYFSFRQCGCQSFGDLPRF